MWQRVGRASGSLPRTCRDQRAKARPGSSTHRRLSEPRCRPARYYTQTPTPGPSFATVTAERFSATWTGSPLARASGTWRWLPRTTNASDGTPNRSTGSSLPHPSSRRRAAYHSGPYGGLSARRHGRRSTPWRPRPGTRCVIWTSTFGTSGRDFTYDRKCCSGSSRHAGLGRTRAQSAWPG
jgi:hypothetical protein